MTTRRGALAALAMVPAMARADDATNVDLGEIGFPGLLPRRVRVWLPPGHARAGRMRALYMHDGQNVFAGPEAFGGQAWEAEQSIMRLMAAGRIAPTLIVAVHNTAQRRRDYMPADLQAALPAPVRDQLTAQQGGAALSDLYLRFLAETLKPRIDATFPTRRGRQHTFIAGSSMGGLISLAALAQRPDVFGAAACLSTHWPLFVGAESYAPGGERHEAAVIAAWQDWLKTRLRAPRGRRLWLDHGDRNLDSFYAPYQAAADVTLAALGWRTGRELQSRVYPGSDHNEASWRARLDEVLGWLMAG